MTGLPRSIIKKYGVTKKAWAVFRGSGHRSSHKSHSSARRVRRHAAVSNVAKKKHSRRSGHSSGGMSEGKLALYGLGYGFVRQPISNVVQNVVGGFLGGVSDDVAMAGLGYLAAKKGSGMIRDLGRVALIAEASNFGRNASQGGLNILSGITGASGGAMTVNGAAGGASFQ